MTQLEDFVNHVLLTANATFDVNDSVAVGSFNCPGCCRGVMILNKMPRFRPFCGKKHKSPDLTGRTQCLN